MTKQVNENTLYKKITKGEKINTQVPSQCPCSVESSKVESIVFIHVGLHTRRALHKGCRGVLTSFKLVELLVIEVS